jgi:hypothetical protein
MRRMRQSLFHEHHGTVYNGRIHLHLPIKQHVQIYAPPQPRAPPVGRQRGRHATKGEHGDRVAEPRLPIRRQCASRRVGPVCRLICLPADFCS